MKGHVILAAAWCFSHCVQSSTTEEVAEADGESSELALGVILDPLLEKHIPDKAKRQLYWKNLGLALSAMDRGPVSEALHKHAADKFENEDLSKGEAGELGDTELPLEKIIHKVLKSSIPKADDREKFFKDLEEALEKDSGTDPDIEVLTKYAGAQAYGEFLPEVKEDEGKS